ncbi:MAG: pilus assembly protein [Cytophagaceae bacterium]|nr:MAG: pilus assembly protein [Cytophagaceae bacterium]
MSKTFLRQLAGSTKGATIIEFAIVCPVMLMLVIGLSEITFQEYLQSVLSGAIQKAARDSTIDGNGSSDANTVIDDKVKSSISLIINSAVWDNATRTNYSHFADIGPEYFFDSNGNSTYDKGECFIDVNGNSTWDADPGSSGQGGANAVVVYQMGFSYPRLFPVAGLLGWSSSAHISASTILKNQPYKFSNTADSTKICK